MPLKLHLLGGFLGSGKTTAIQMACMELMKENIPSAVITNDQGMKLVDSAFFRKYHIPVRQVVNGCFCCHYGQLESSIESLVNTETPAVIFAETVGSCADLVATVIRPLQYSYPDVQLSFSVFADARLLFLVLKGEPGLFDEEVTYLYLKQLEEASLIIVNKTDLVSAGLLEDLELLLDNRYGNKEVIYQNSLDAENIRQWLKILGDIQPGDKRHNLDIDYERYAAGEAHLSWLDQEIEIHKEDGSAPEVAVSLAYAIYGAICRAGYPIGHLKFMLDDASRFSFTGPGMPEPDLLPNESTTCRLLINARVQADSDSLGLLVSDRIKEAANANGIRITSHSLSVFSPGYPRPEKRVLV